MKTDEIHIANPGEMYQWHRASLYRFWFGQTGTTFVYVWSQHDHLDSAFEEAVDWLVDNDLKGYFVTVGLDELKEAAADEGIEWQPHWPDWDDPDPKFSKVLDAAEADLTPVGNTALGTHIPSWEWGLDDVTDKDEQRAVAEASFREHRDLLDFDREAFGIDEGEPDSGLRVTVDDGEVTVVDWTDLEAATGERTAEGEEVVRLERRMPVEKLLAENAQWRGSYSGDEGWSLGEVLVLGSRQDREDAIVAAAIAAISYGPNDESLVSYVGED